MPLLSLGEDVFLCVVDEIIYAKDYCELYRVIDENGQQFMMKVFLPDAVPAELLTEKGVVREIEAYESIKYADAIAYEITDFFEENDKPYPFIMTKYMEGKTLVELINEDYHFGVEETVHVFKVLTDTLVRLHGKNFLHNNLCPSNVRLYQHGQSTDVLLTGFGHTAAPCDGKVPFNASNLDPLYQATETFWKTYSVASDVFSLGATIYTMLYGHAPWESKLPEKGSYEYEKNLRTTINNDRHTAPQYDSRDDVPQWLVRIIAKCLENKPQFRYDSCQELLKDLKDEGSKQVANTSEQTTKKTISEQTTKAIEDTDPALYVPDGEHREGNGFGDVAGLESLKTMLKTKVIFLLKNKELAERYKLVPPNGMLLYGPPGCGKTYFAEKFAEESGYNFHFIKASDIGSIYIHGSQGKIAELFKKAEKNAPSIICFDEFDAMAPNRDNVGTNSPSMSGEVNEFLSQLNNCSQRGLFIIGTTNKPDLIDQAVLRKGRLDLQVFVPAPDQEARKAMFDLYLKDRPCDAIDTEQLARMTDNYAGSDIAYVVNDAAMTAALAGELIKQSTVEKAINDNPPSLNDSTLRYYKKMKDHFERRTSNRPTIGFAAVRK